MRPTPSEVENLNLSVRMYLHMVTKLIRAVAGVAVLALVAPACGSDGPKLTTDAGPTTDLDGAVDAPRADGPGVDEAPPRPAGGAMIGANGGKLVSDDGHLTLDIPREALSASLMISIGLVAAPPAGVRGPMYQIGPLGTRLAKAATVTFKPAPEDIAGLNPATLLVASYTIWGQWVPLGNVVSSAGTVKATTDVFSKVGLMPGLCTACPPPCDPAKCVVGAGDGIPGVPGQCVAFGAGCSRCVPFCDHDGDGYCPGSPSDNQPGGDCDENNPAVHPEAVEVCGNTVDENCNGHQDEGCRPCTKDTDCPVGFEACTKGVCEICSETCEAATCGFGGVNGSEFPGRCAPFGRGCMRCVPGCDTDGDGFCPGMRTDGQPAGDCDDQNPMVSPEGVEICGNNIDDDCDGQIDEICTSCTGDMECPSRQRCVAGLCAACPVACDPATCRFGVMPGVPDSGIAGMCVAQGNGCSVCVPNCDGDGDGSCPGSPPNDQPGGDCNDSDPRVGPDALEICGNNVDDNCDNHKDEGCQPCNSDADCTTGLEACVEGVCTICGSCAAVDCTFGPTPGKCISRGRGCMICVPTCDQDGDGFCPGPDQGEQPGGDCNDMDPKIHAKGHEICGNGVDDDCNGKIDDGCAICEAAVACGAMQSCSSGK
jgi:hypothetical protein